MEWCKLYSRYPDDPAVQRVGEAAEVLFLRSLAYCAREESDGFVPDTQLSRFGLTRVAARATALAREGLWEPANGGWQVVRWRDLQPTTERVKRKRQADRERVAAKRDVACDSRASRTSVAQVSRGPSVEERRTTPPDPPTGGKPCRDHKRRRSGCEACRLGVPYVGFGSRPLAAVCALHSTPQPCISCAADKKAGAL